jgi:hypothetical protein
MRHRQNGNVAASGWLRSGRVRAIALFGALVVVALAWSGHAAAGPTSTPIDPAWMANSLGSVSTPTAVRNNLTPGADAARDKAVSDWKAAVGRYRAGLTKARAAGGPTSARLARAAKAPNPLAKPEYVVVWSSHQNAGDQNFQQAQTDAGNVLGDPEGWPSNAQDRFIPGLDGWQVVDARKLNTDGTPNPTYGKVVNFVQIPAPWGIEAEAHHMQYQWENGQPIIAGGLFNTTTFVLDTAQLPKLTLENTMPPQSAPGGSIPDAYDYAGNGRFIGTYMGGPTNNYGGSPGEVVTFKPDPTKGLVVGTETPAGAVDARDLGNPGGIPEPCGQDEAAPLNTCANPHGIQIRPDLGRMVTADYAEPKMVVLDPVKPNGGMFFRPTVRIWDTSNPDHPVLTSVAHMPTGWRPADNANSMHNNRGVMEDAKTWPVTPQFPTTLASKGFFAGAMCGGGVFFTPDVTKLTGDSTRQWNEVFDDGIALLAARGGQVDDWMRNEGPCEGGAWMQTSRNNKRLFRAVAGQAPNTENDFGRGQPIKVIYELDITKLIQAAQSGHITCDLSRGMDTNGDGTIDLSGPDAVRQIASGQQVADCPHLISALPVDDHTSGGPHWGALDNHSLTPDGFPTRMVFSDYFVSRSGVDGNHHLYMVDIDPTTGKLTYDQSWRDEFTGELGVNFNRTNWPDNATTGYYKPHSMLWVCPPGICPADSPG